MGYNETLSKMIKTSGLTLREISKKCKEEYGIKVDASYLSKLQSEKHPPASDEVNIAIAKVCGGDSEELLFEAYMEKAPDSIRNLISNMVKYFRSLQIDLYKSQTPKAVAEKIENIVNEIPTWEYVKEMLKEENLPKLDKDGKFFVKTQDQIFKNVLMHVSPHACIEMQDNSMEPIIDKGVMLQLGDSEDIDSNDIVLAMLEKDQHYYIRRYVPVGNQVFLIAENKKFKPITVDKKAVVMFKVKSLTKKL